MRIRTIKPEFWTNEKLCSLHECAHLFAAALLNYVDDEGYFNANPRLIKGALFPLREPSVSIPVMLKELSSVGYLELGEADDGREYGRVVHFLEHQVVNRPSPSKIKGLAISWNTHGTLTEHSVSPHSGNGKEQGKEQGTGNREQGHAPARVTCTKDKIERDFDLFWAAYPKKVGKKDALRRFRMALKSGLPPIEVLVASIEKQRDSDQWRRDGGQYIPNPSTWLNQGRWEDELREGPGRKLLPQERAHQEIEAWLAEVESSDGTEDDSLLFAGNSRELPGEVAADEANEPSMGGNAARSR